nr:hypothetical protein [Tanacetum cinerariifolium]
DLCPRFVQALVPDAGGEELDRVHLVDEAEDLGGGTALVEGTDDVRVGDDVGLEFAGLDIEDEDED